MFSLPRVWSYPAASYNHVFIVFLGIFSLGFRVGVSFKKGLDEFDRYGGFLSIQIETFKKDNPLNIFKHN